MHAPHASYIRRSSKITGCSLNRSHRVISPGAAVGSRMAIRSVPISTIHGSGVRSSCGTHNRGGLVDVDRGVSAIICITATAGTIPTPSSPRAPTRTKAVPVNWIVASSVNTEPVGIVNRISPAVDILTGWGYIRGAYFGSIGVCDGGASR